ncbi:hypothetical protein GQ457_14G024900 [Hibiscus cannabinus]
MRARGDHRPSNPRHAVDGPAYMATDRRVRGNKRRDKGDQEGSGAGGRGRVRGYEGISCGREQAFRVKRDAAAVRCISYGDVSAVAEEA